jgi:hypothetical protein
VDGEGGKLETQPAIIIERITMKWTNIVANFSSKSGSDELRIRAKSQNLGFVDAIPVI